MWGVYEMLNAANLDKSQYLLYAWHRQDSDQEIKIGKSTAGRLYGRIVTAQTDNPYPIVFLGVQLVDAENEHEIKSYENSILKEFNKVRDEGEWVYRDEVVNEWLTQNCIPVAFEDFKGFHRDKTRELRKKPAFVERERRKTRERRAQQKAIKEQGLPEVVDISEDNSNITDRRSSGMFKKRK